MVKLKLISPLDAKMAYQSRDIDIEVVSDYGFIRFQSFSRGSESKETLSEKLDFVLPVKGHVQTNDNNTVFWSAPSEWVIAIDSGTEEEQVELLSNRLSGKLKGIHHSLTIMTDSRIVLRLCGPQARQLLAKGSAVDFHPSVFYTGLCVTTKFAQIPIMIAQVNEDDEFLLFADRSLAVYLLSWLTDAAEEFEN